MNDDLDDLKAMMNDATPRPDTARRAENLARAQKNFDDLQGSRVDPRPIPVTGPKGLWTGVKTMLNTMTSKGALTATTALVACGFLFMTPQGQDLLRAPSNPQITLTEFDGLVEAPQVEQEPFRAEEMASDMITQEPLQPPFGQALQEPLIVPEQEFAFEESAPTEHKSEAAPEQSTATLAAPAGSEPTISARSQPRTSVQNENDGLFLGDTSEGAETEWTSADDMKAETGHLGITFSGNFRLGYKSEQEPEYPLSADPDFQAQADAAAALNAPAILIEQGSLLGNIQTPQTTPNTETFANADTNPLQITAETPVSTFSIDVDTASYGVLRSSLSRGQLPSAQSVRIEELINYFPYAYPSPNTGEAPFRPTVTTFETPWNANTQLVHIALQGQMPTLDDRPPLNLVFLIDTSGSMNDPSKLPLLKQSFRLMLDQLRPEDEVAIVEYAGSAGQVLAPTAASERTTILQAIESLGAGGSTNGQGGLEQAYSVAETMRTDGEVNRVILATDGDFNVGLNSPDALKDFIANKRDTGTYLSVLGFGRGNLDDATMQALAQNGNGTAAYIDTLSEAQKVLVDQLSGALFPIAGDVKVQVEFNPAQVAEYRLIGYETRALNREDFNNDAVDAGELGAGHSVTAIYEITPVGSPAQLSDPLRYAPNTVAASSDELGFLKLRYKEPGQSVSQLIETPISGSSIPGTEANFAAAIAGFGQLLRNPQYLGDWGYDDAIALANASRGDDDFGYRTEAVQLMRLAQSLSQ